jgi:uncharacterized paraquat-inducible protein A
MTETRNQKQRRSVHCPECDDEFLAYRTDMTPQCPRCGHVVKTLVHRRMLRIIGVAVLIAVVVFVVAALLMGK